MTLQNGLIQDRIQYLRDNTDFVSTVFDSLIGYAIVAADFDGNIIAYNEGAHQSYGYPASVCGDVRRNAPRDHGAQDAGLHARQGYP